MTNVYVLSVQRYCTQQTSWLHAWLSVNFVAAMAVRQDISNALSGVPSNTIYTRGRYDDVFQNAA